MKCPNCQFINADGAKYCNQCGNRLEIICTECKTSNKLGSKFCNECGKLLAEPADRPLLANNIEKIKKYLPKGLAEKILSQRDRIERERKQVTVMFCDLAGFTPLVEYLGPEDAYSFMDRVYELLIHKVHDYEGVVNELTGDGILALFGAPIALEDAPQRAIRSSLAIHREMARFNDRIKHETPGLPTIKMRIGIHTGPVVVGTLGNDLRVEFKAVGDTVNVASRMEGLAEPGSTYISYDTFKLIEGLFRVEALGKKEIRGKKKNIRVFRVIAPSTRRTRFDVSAERGLTPFVGRERELELLLDSLERAKNGTGQAFSVIGEAGIGKSRFLYEFRKAISHEDITFLEGKSLSYGKGVPYHSISDVLKGNFDIREDDDDERVRRKVKKGLEILKANEESVLPFILELLGIKDPDADRLPLSFEGKKEKIFETIRQIILKGAQIRPLVIAIEDLHWADKSTAEVLKLLIEDAPGARILIIFTYRPEFVHTWGGRSYYNQITLNRLSNRESLLIAENLLGMDVVDPELHSLILSKTEGVPFFIEEFVKSLLSLDVIKNKDGKLLLDEDYQSVAIPSTIQDMIMARVDQLSDEAKDVLLTGSVIEREFPHSLLQAVTNLAETELITCLSTLKEAELLYERGVYPQTSYIFRHALTRDVAYASIIDRRRRDLHRRIGVALEEIHENDPSEHYEILAEHFYQGGDYAKAADYSKSAARKAEKRASLLDAVTHARKRILCLEKAPEYDSLDRELIDARTSLGLYLFQLYYFVEAKEITDPIFMAAVDTEYAKRVAQLYTIMGSYSYWVREDFEVAIKQLETAAEYSNQTGDVVSEFFSNQWLGFAHAYCCNFSRSNIHFRKALQINIDTKNTWGASVVMSCLSHWVFNYKGLTGQGLDMSRQALNIALKSGDIYSKAIACTHHGVSFYFKGDNEQAEEYLLEGVALNKKIEFQFCLSIAHFFLGHSYFQKTAYKEAAIHYQKAINALELIQCLPSKVRLCRLCILLIDIINNKSKEDIDQDEVAPYVENNRLKVYEGWVQHKIAEIFLHSKKEFSPESEQWIKKAIHSNSQNGTIWSLAEDYALYSKILVQKGELEKAGQFLHKAKSIYAKCHADGWIAKIENQLTALASGS